MSDMDRHRGDEAQAEAALRLRRQGWLHHEIAQILRISPQQLTYLLEAGGHEREGERTGEASPDTPDSETL